MADWSQLPIDILGLVVQHFELMEDYHRFLAVCRCWRSLTPTEKKPKFSLKFPSLMFTDKNQEGIEQARWKFYSQLTSQVHEINLPEASGKRCLGIYPGWILTLGLDDFEFNILNPFTRQRYNLPSMLHFIDQDEYIEEFKPRDVTHKFVHKIVASTSPEQDDCTVLAIYGLFKMLAFARLRDHVWTPISTSADYFDDVLYFKGKFYAVDPVGVTFVCDLNDKDGPTAMIAAPAPLDPCLPYMKQKYLVESCGDLYLLSRIRGGYLYHGPHSKEDKSRYFTVRFYVFRLVRDESCTDPYRLEDVNDLGNRAFFIGYNVSTSISSSDFVRGNCIYFCDDNWDLYNNQFGGGGHDTGIFDMKTREVEWHYVSQFQFRSRINPPFWYY